MQKWAAEVGGEHNFQIQEFEVGDSDHVHCFISAPPKVNISDTVKILKGTLARRAFMKYPELKNKLRKGILWNHSYYVETVGSISEDAIRKYIERQTNSY